MHEELTSYGFDGFGMLGVSQSGGKISDLILLISH